MRRFAIISNSKKDEGLRQAQLVEEKLEAHGAYGVVSDLCGASLNIPGDTEGLLVIGGDGSMLSAAKLTYERGLPMIGVNMGTVGYLTEVERSEIDAAIRQLVAGDYHIEERMMLEGSCVDGGVVRAMGYALNDVVLNRRGDLQVVGYRVYVNDLFLTDFYADGVIVSTPTGSTGYNLSAGGPIVEPSASLLLLTPVCPHTLGSRSIILPPEDVVTIKLLPPRSQREARAGADFDGGSTALLKSGDSIVISRAKIYTRIIKLRYDGFLQILQRKLS